MTKKRIALLVLVAIIFNFVTVLAVDTAIKTEYDGVTETLTLEGAVSSNGCDGVIYAHDKANLTINGTGSVHGELCGGSKCGKADCGFGMAVYADQDSTITINGGTYTNDSDPNYPSQTDLIYAARNSTITINGGTFKCSTPAWTLNCKNDTKSEIIVKGGRFYKYDPTDKSVESVGKNEIIVPEGYAVIKDGDWYEVKKIEEFKEYNRVTETLELNSDFIANGCDGAIYAHDESNLTINGTGSVHGVLCRGAKCGDKDCGFGMAVYANEKTTITINGGTYTNDLDPNYPTQTDLIYAANNSIITINGGTFKCSTPAWTLNCKNDTKSEIIVKGGRFYKYDPTDKSVESVGKNEIIVPEEYKVVADGDWYEVVCAHKNGKAHAEVPATYAETGTEAHWECSLCSKLFTDATAKTEITDKNSLVIPKLAEVQNNNANITENAFDTAIKEAETTNSSTVVIPAVKTEETVASVTVPVNSLKDVADASKELSIETSVVTVTMDTEAIKEVVKQAGNIEDVKIEVVEVEEKSLNEKQKEAIKDKEVATIISAQIIANGKNISDFGDGKVVVEIPFVLDENEKGEDYTVIYIADDGTITEIPTKYVDGKIIIELEHFSEYALVKVAETENKPTEDKPTENKPTENKPTEDKKEETTNIVQTGDNIVIYISILVISLIGVGIVIIKKNNKK